MAITQKDIDLLNSHTKQVKVEVALFDDNYVEIENLSGRVKSASYDISSESDIRRTCSLTMVIPKKDQMELDFRNTWIKRMVELRIGVYDKEDDDYVWYSMGKMLMKDGNTSYSATTQEVKLSLVDLMSTLTEIRGSQMGTSLLIPASSNIRDAIIAIVTTFSPFKRYDVVQFDDTIPYDITVDIGRYPYDALKEILNLYPYYEMFYDIDGIFKCRHIPTKTDDPVDVGNDIIDNLIIKENSTVNFSDVKNTTEIWGRSLDAKYTATNCTSTGSRYDITIDDTFEELVVGETYSFVPDATSVSGQTMKIQDTTAYQIYTQSGDGTYSPITAGSMQAGVPYCIMYTDQHFVLQGELQIHVIVQEIDQMPSSTIQNQFKQENACRDVQWVVDASAPFACTITAGKIQREIRRVLSGGEYDAIYTTELAYERAKYENWLTTKLQDSVEFDCVLIPWMEVNDKIQYTSPVSEEIGTYTIQNISYNFQNWTMTVKANRFSQLYPWE